MADTDIDSRVARLEKLVDQLIEMARENPIGRVFLKRLGL